MPCCGCDLDNSIKVSNGKHHKGYKVTKEELIEILKRVLKTESDLEFLLKLDDSELETLVAVIRDRVECTT